MRDEAARLDVSESVRERLLELEAVTLHRPRLAAEDPQRRRATARWLPFEVIIDETSMVPLWMMARLLEAVRPQARLVLIGDPGQLASVEAGAVLGDIVGPAEEEPDSPLGKRVVTLDRVHRYGEEIAELAEAIRAGDADTMIELLEKGGNQVQWIDADPGDPASMPLLEPVRKATVEAGRAAFEAAAAGDAKAALEAMAKHRILCAHRRGPHGVRRWNLQAEAWIAEEVEAFDPFGRWYVGRPLLVTQNSYELKLYNGDTGIVIQRPNGQLTAAFPRGDDIVEVSPTQLEAAETVYTMTIHKSQGSQFEAVSVLLPPESSRITSRELLYTAATRTRERLTLMASADAIRAASVYPVARASGLPWRLRPEGTE
ncbi:MAG: AAA family ATPase [Solirubrobacterales bacterium]